MSEPVTFYSGIYIKPKKRMGQHFLKDMGSVHKIIAALDLSPDEDVVELGAGKGILTKYLLAKAKRVIAIELDAALCHELKYRFGHLESFRLFEKDILGISFEEICNDLNRPKVKVVGNLPYNITSPILFKLIDDRKFVELAIIMMQMEVARRVATGPGNKDYGVPSIITQIYGKPELLFEVPPRAFSPPPKVRSAVVKLTWHEQPPIELGDEKLYFRIVRAVFSQRRKMLRNSLLIAPHVTKENLAAIETETSIDLTRRPETLDLKDFALLTSAVKKFS